MKSFLISIIFLASVHAADWYVNDEVSGGSNDGTSWANSWNSFSAISWSGMSAGDTLYISGGPAGGSNVYTSPFTTGKAGLTNNPITIKVGTDEGHNGMVVVSNLVTLAHNFITLNGGKDPDATWPVGLPFTTNNLANLLETNINFHVSNPNGHGLLMQGLYSSKAYWVGAHNCGEAQINTPVKIHGIVHYYNAAAGSIVRDAKIAYCKAWFNSYDGINFTANNATNFDSIEISYCQATDNGDDNMQLSGGLTLHHSYIYGKRLDLAVGHPDALQVVAGWNKIYNNYIFGFKNSWVYHEFGYNRTNDFGHWYIYNNVFANDQAWQNSGYGYYLGTQMTGANVNEDFVMPAKDGGQVTINAYSPNFIVGARVVLWSEIGSIGQGTNFAIMDIAGKSGTYGLILSNPEPSAGGEFENNVEPGTTVPAWWVQGSVSNRTGCTTVLYNAVIDDVYIVNNTFVNGYQSGITISGSTNHVKNTTLDGWVFKNNLAYDAGASAGQAGYALNSSQSIYNYDSTGLVLENNILAGSRGKRVRYEGTLYDDINSIGSNNTSNAPIFLDYSTYRVSLATNDTVARNAGQDLSALEATLPGISKDITGADRTGVWDIGAYEGLGLAEGEGGTGPSITDQPDNDTIDSGQTAALSVTANGDPVLSYQWYIGTSGSTGSPITGANSSSYTTPALTETTLYWVRVVNDFGSADSTAATITVNPAEPGGGESNRRIRSKTARVGTIQTP